MKNAIECYAERSPLARAYRRGGAARARLLATLMSFQDDVAMRIGEVKPAGEGRARVSATLVQSRGQLRSTRRVEMLFVREADRWLILREGF